jgi:hypothetical protein
VTLRRIAGPLVVLGVLAFAGTAASGNRTQNVVLVLLGGVRNTECFADSTHAYTPYLWDSLAPHGTMYADFRNMLIPGLKSSHWQVLVGARDYLSSHSDQYHWFYPTIFEAYRKTKLVPEDKAWMVLLHRGLTRGTKHSIHPQFGIDYRASQNLDHGSDVEVFRRTVGVMATYHPSLLEVGFHEVDEVAQEVGDFDAYARAIAVVDSLVWELWAHTIQADTIYRDRTTLIVTSEHGRHSSDFRGHGDDCEGCRRLPFLALGPDIRQGAIVSTRADLIDVAPTIAALLEVPLTSARGRVLEEMLTPGTLGDRKTGLAAKQPDSSSRKGTRLSSTAGMSCSPSVAINRDGIHVVWMERRPSPDHREFWDVLYTRSTDRGRTWSIPEAILRSSPDTVYYYVAVAANDSSGTVVAASGYRWMRPEGSYRWGLQARVLPPGAAWRKPTPIVSGPIGVEYAGMDSRPSIALDGGSIAIASMSVGQNRGPTHTLMLHSSDRGLSWRGSEFLQNLPGDERRPCYPHGLTIAAGRNQVSLVRSIRFPAGWEPSSTESDANIYLSQWRSRTKEIPFLEMRPDSGGGLDSMPGQSLFPCVTALGDTLHLVWANMTETDWGIYYRRSLSGGNDWNPVLRLSSSSAWRPQIACMHNEVLCVWEDCGASRSRVVGRLSRDGGATWSPDQVISDSPGDCAQPAVALSSGIGCTVWQDDSNGNWEIYAEATPSPFVESTARNGH